MCLLTLDGHALSAMSIIATCDVGGVKDNNAKDAPASQFFWVLSSFHFISCASKSVPTLVCRWQEVNWKETIDLLRTDIFEVTQSGM